MSDQILTYASTAPTGVAGGGSDLRGDGAMSAMIDVADGLARIRETSKSLHEAMLAADVAAGYTGPMLALCEVVLVIERRVEELEGVVASALDQMRPQRP